MKEPILIKAGDEKVRLHGSAPKVDCRVVAEDRYQSIQHALSLCANYGYNSEKGREGRKLAKILLTAN